MEEENRPIILTGIRPTSNLTIANYIGAIMPILSFQKEGHRPYVFVADLHALTDNEPEVLKYGNEILLDFLAAGIDPQKTIMYKQSDIAGEIGSLTLLLARHVTVAELLRVPTLKEKSKSGEIEGANGLLAMYPVMMAADILVQRSSVIPVGKDQVVHIELSRNIAKRFNKNVKRIFPEPGTHIVETVKIMSLRGDSKMSKSLPEDAIFLTDNPEVVRRKIGRAQTALAGEMSESLKSHLSIVQAICTDKVVLGKVDEIIEEHLKGSKVMGAFKKLFSEIVIDFLFDFQSRRNNIIVNKEEHMKSLYDSRNTAITRAKETMKMVFNAFNI